MLIFFSCRNKCYIFFNFFFIFTIKVNLKAKLLKKSCDFADRFRIFILINKTRHPVANSHDFFESLDLKLN